MQISLSSNRQNYFKQFSKNLKIGLFVSLIANVLFANVPLAVGKSANAYFVSVTTPSGAGKLRIDCGSTRTIFKRELGQTLGLVLKPSKEHIKGVGGNVLLEEAAMDVLFENNNEVFRLRNPRWFAPLAFCSEPLEVGIFGMDALMASGTLLDCGAAQLLLNASSISSEDYVRVACGRHERMLLLAEVEINGKRYAFLVDSGSEKSTIDANVLQEVGTMLSEERSSTVVGQGGNASMKVAPYAVPMFSIGGVSVSNSVFYALQTPAMAWRDDKGNTKYAHVSGVLGLDLLKELGAVIDARSGAVYIKKKRASKTYSSTQAFVYRDSIFMGIKGYAANYATMDSLKGVYELSVKNDRANLQKSYQTFLGQNSVKEGETFEAFKARLAPKELEQFAALEAEEKRIEMNTLAYNDMLNQFFETHLKPVQRLVAQELEAYAQANGIDFIWIMEEVNNQLMYYNSMRNVTQEIVKRVNQK